MSKILSKYDWRKNPLVKILMEEGPNDLLKFLENDDARAIQKGHYVSKCDLCIEIRKRLDPQKLQQD